MQIVIEYVLIENFLINYFILKTCATFMKKKASLILLSSLFGSLFALFYPLLNLNFFGIIISELLVGAIMVCISFEFKTLKDFLYYYFAFALMTCVFGGGVVAVENIIGQTSLFVITLIAGIIFFCTQSFLFRFNKKKNVDNFRYAVRLFSNGKLCDETGYFDSGNMLYDTISKKPIILITPTVFERLTGQNYFEFLLKNDCPAGLLKNCHYVSAGTSMSQGKMLVFEIDKLQILSKNSEIKEYEGVCVGLSFADFNKTFESSLLLHSTFI